MTFDSPHSMASVDGDSTKLFIAEADGYVWLVPDITQAAPAKQLFLDISDRVFNNGNEIAMKGIACHPDYSTNGHIYVTYNTGTARSRLSRFTRSAINPAIADPTSELILIDQLSEGDGHSISTCRFGSDGYLYLGFGDEGTQVDAHENSQYIDKDLFSAILRIDIDKLPGNLEPNADSDIPRDSGGNAYFSIPNDNPFIGINEFNGQPVASNEVRTEFYMLGFRNPWQFNFLPGTDGLIVADVGRSAYEELSIIPRAGNGGWSWREAEYPGIRSGQLINGAAESDADLTPPIMSYSHSVGSSITGGLYYENINYPGLTNRYLFADYVSGSIWAIAPFAESPQREFIAGEQAIVGFLQDPSDGGILLLDRGLVGSEPGAGRVLKLKYGSDVAEKFPATLSKTNFFADIKTLRPNPGVIAYEPNLRFWSDHATKKRWFHIPDPAELISFATETPWHSPSGMIWAKHFELEMERGNPATKRPVETRFLIKNNDGAYGVSYRWNDGGTEAFLVAAGGDNIEYDIIDGPDTITQQWRIPSRTECLTCHTETAGYALSFNTRQLNREGTLHGDHGNFIKLLSQSGYLVDAPNDISELPRHVRPDETAYSLEARARAYLAVNCAYCHQPSGGTPNSWDGRAHLQLFETGMVDGTSIDAPINMEDRLLQPGSTLNSIIWNRMGATNDYSRMPPLATSVVDTVGIDLLAAWIVQELPDRIDYTSWRISKFGNAISTEGEADEDPDSDSKTNYQEFVQGSEPRSYDSPLSPSLSILGENIYIARPGLLGRNVLIETSSDLGQTDPWHRWDAEMNNSVPVQADTQLDLSAKIESPSGFFRFRITEQ